MAATTVKIVDVVSLHLSEDTTALLPPPPTVPDTSLRTSDRSPTYVSDLRVRPTCQAYVASLRIHPTCPIVGPHYYFNYLSPLSPY